MCQQWEHLKLRNPVHFLMICIPEVHETDSTILRITPNCNELHVKCDKCGSWITFGDPETIETIYKPVKGLKYTKDEIDKLLGVVRSDATLKIANSDTSGNLYFYDGDLITVRINTNEVASEAKLAPIEIDLHNTSASLWKINQPQYDTTKIIMLVGDTSEIYISTRTINNARRLNTHEHRTITWIKRDDPVYWMYGYIVSELDINLAERLNPLMKPIFLDLSKNPISKNIIVWDWREVE